MCLNVWKLRGAIWYSSDKLGFVAGKLADYIRSISRVTGHLPPHIVLIIGAWNMSRSYSKVRVFLIWNLEFEQAKASWKPHKSNHKAAGLHLNLDCL